jgi:hypothetical protein
LPQYVAAFRPRDPTRHDEKMIRQAVEVDQSPGVEPDLAARADGPALGPADDGAGEVKLGRPAAPARQDEAPQGLEILVHGVDLGLQPVNLRLDDAQRHVGRGEILAGRGEIGAEVEQFVLDRRQHGSGGGIRDLPQGNADRRIGLVDIADRLRAPMVLGDPRPVGKAGVTGVAGARVNLVELDQA